MKKSSDIRVDTVLKAILGEVEPEKRNTLVQHLPEREREILEKLPLASGPIDFDASIHYSVLGKVHWSWFLPTLKSYSENEQKLFLSSLNQYAAKHLARALTLSLSGAGLTGIARTYFRNMLLDSLLGQGHRLLPPQLLPATHLTRLLELNNNCLLYTSPSPRDRTRSRMPSSA